MTTKQKIPPVSDPTLEERHSNQNCDGTLEIMTFELRRRGLARLDRGRERRRRSREERCSGCFCMKRSRSLRRSDEVRLGDLTLPAPRLRGISCGRPRLFFFLRPPPFPSTFGGGTC